MALQDVLACTRVGEFENPEGFGVQSLSQYMSVIIAGAVVIALLVVALLAWRKLAGNVHGRRGQRLGISEYHEIDKMRRLVLVRRDNVEHLILIGGPQDVVIEQGIGPGRASSFAPQAEELRVEAPMPMRPAPRAERRPPPLRTAEIIEDPVIINPRLRDLPNP